jgi:DNA helicase-2/ATP-dependent DNA helicase PcrA
MAYFRVVVSPDDDLAFERIVNTPKRGLGDKAQQTIQRMARSNGVSLLEGARLCVETKAIGGKGAKELSKLLDGIAHWRGLMTGGLRQVGPTDDLIEDDRPPTDRVSHVELAEIILDESGYTAHWQNDKTPEAPGRLENLKELVKALESFENLQGFLEHVALIMDNEKEDEEPKVTLMTLHAAKGLEFPAVFLPGWEDGLFPSQRAMDESGMQGLEEERRLAYVGITRAEEVCTISFAGNRRVYGQWQSQLPSRFIDELPEDTVDVLTPPGLYGHQGGMAATASPVSQTMAGSDLHANAAKADVYNSPGWRRLQANQGRQSLRQPTEARHMTIDAEAVSAFAIGDRVFHQKFGYGEVMSVEGDKLGVEFDKAGSKHVVGRFLVAAGRDGDVPF